MSKYMSIKENSISICILSIRNIICGLTSLLAISVIACTNKHESDDYIKNKNEIRQKAFSRSTNFKPFLNDLSYFEPCCYRINVYSNQSTFDDFTFYYLNPLGYYDYFIIRSNRYCADTAIHVFEFQDFDDFYEKKCYIRISKKYSNTYKGLVLKWINRPLETKLPDWDEHSALDKTYNWNIDEFTDTVYSTLPKHIIEREYPEFRGVYKYLDLKSINIKGKITNTHPDSLLSIIELEYNKGK